MFAIQPELLDTIQRSHIDFLNYIGLVKSGYQVSNFLISQQKHMLWVLIRSTSVRNKKNIDTFWLKNTPDQELCKFLDFMYGEMLRVSGYFE